ncbi:MAG: Spy/CpxP family protein refolding chaperone [Candidatus Omnitrophica bacterium]|nr:Spy/CpxP family protein refolding chaperone [Candidatus Omnitrophota bacterium]
MIKEKITTLVMAATFAVSLPLAYADQGNGGNLTGGQSGASVSSEASQDHHGWQHGKGHGCKDHKGGKFFNNLTDAQKKQLKENFKKQKEAMKAVFEQMKTNKEALNQELAKPDSDMNKISQIQTQIKTLQAQMVDDRLNSILEVKKILTSEQFAKFLEFKAKHKFGKHGHHKGYREGHDEEEE